MVGKVMELSKCGGVCRGACKHYAIGEECPPGATYEPVELKPPTLADVKEWMQLTDGKGGIGRRDLMEWLIVEVERLTNLADGLNATANSAFLDGRRNAEGELEAEQGRWQEAIYNLIGDLAPGADIDGGGCDSGDPLDLTLAEIAQGFSYWDNLLFETMESVSHSYVDTPTFKAAADFIVKLAAENEELSQKVCDECAGDGWVENRVEGRGTCTCMVEAEPFQILLDAMEKLACLGSGDQFGNSIGNVIAIEALRAVLPLHYAGESPASV